MQLQTLGEYFHKLISKAIHEPRGTACTRAASRQQLMRVHLPCRRLQRGSSAHPALGLLPESLLGADSSAGEGGDG